MSQALWRRHAGIPHQLPASAPIGLPVKPSYWEIAPGAANAAGQNLTLALAAQYGKDDISFRRLLADNGSPDGDQTPAATRITLRPHDSRTGQEIDKRTSAKDLSWTNRLRKKAA